MAQEKNFENRLRTWLHSMGIYSAGMPNDKQTETPIGWYLKIWGGGFQKSGIPDLLMCVNGIFIAAELKSSVGKPTDLQRKNIEMVNRGGGWRPGDNPEELMERYDFTEDEAQELIEELYFIEDAQYRGRARQRDE